MGWGGCEVVDLAYDVLHQLAGALDGIAAVHRGGDGQGELRGLHQTHEELRSCLAARAVDFWGGESQVSLLGHSHAKLC